MAVFQIDVVADFICAWCFIAKRQLEQAISLYEKTYPGGKYDEFQITWIPYFLNYHDSAQSVDKLDLAKEKLGHMSSNQRDALQQRMERLGRSVGINFKWGGKIGRTQDAHRLAYAARLKSPQTHNDVVEAIFRAYQEEERDISCRSELRSIAVAAGLEEADIEDCFNDVEIGNIIEGDAEKYALRIGSGGVPTFIMQDSHVLHGAQDVQDLMEVFVDIKASNS